MMFTHRGVLWENIGSFGNTGENKQQKINWMCSRKQHVYQTCSHTSFKITKYSEYYVLWVIAVKGSTKCGYCWLTLMLLRIWVTFFWLFSEQWKRMRRKQPKWYLCTIFLLKPYNRFVWGLDPNLSYSNLICDCLYLW